MEILTDKNDSKPGSTRPATKKETTPVEIDVLAQRNRRRKEIENWNAKNEEWGSYDEDYR